MTRERGASASCSKPFPRRQDSQEAQPAGDGGDRRRPRGTPSTPAPAGPDLTDIPPSPCLIGDVIGQPVAAAPLDIGPDYPLRGTAAADVRARDGLKVTVLDGYLVSQQPALDNACRRIPVATFPPIGAARGIREVVTGSQARM